MRMKGKDEEKKRLECYVVVIVIIVVDGGAVGCCYCTHTHDALVTQSGRSFSIPTSPAGRSILFFFNKIRKKTIRIIHVKCIVCLISRHIMTSSVDTMSDVLRSSQFK